jgi:DNA transformation protein
MTTTLDRSIATWLDLLGPLGSVRARKMFGGAAMYLDGQVFALLTEAQLYLKVDARTRADFLAEGCGPFVWTSNDGVAHTMHGYHQLPDRLLDDTDDLHAWVRRAVAAGLRAAKPVAAPTRSASKAAKKVKRR